MGKDAMNRVSTNGLFVALLFQIGITCRCRYYHCHCFE
ncbi:hypothetical protein GXM_01119 [Nostoc sphaeroides CCNUC1]|uniref:Uncharacterized protein n=1 Tax=Nostoc sphaeroides CCNUC1 TaxID=2653204 RepID=A0A5P8VU37_9NOSO|nr:hypothetical protein GXM_01119 [Nostoc sphaeroides CCNUC1]